MYVNMCARIDDNRGFEKAPELWPFLCLHRHIFRDNKVNTLGADALRRQVIGRRVIDYEK